MFKLLKLSALTRKMSLPADTESEMRQRNDAARIEELADEVKAAVAAPKSKKRKAAEPEVVVVSTTTVSTVDEVVGPALPPIEARKKKNRNDKPKPAGVLFTATYGDASVLGKLLGKMEKFTNDYQLLFTTEGLETTFLERSRTMLVEVKVPCKSFARYTTVAERAIDFVVTSRAMKNFAEDCEQGLTLTFTYDQCGDEDEPLELKLYPADGDVQKTQVTRLALPAQTRDEPAVVSNGNYQYVVRLPAKLFLKNVRRCGKESETICFALSADSFDMIAAAGNSEHMLTKQISMQRGAGLDTELADQSCIIHRMPGADPRVKLEHMNGYRLSAAFLESAAALSTVPQCDEIVLRLGVEFHANAPDKYDEVPLHMRFPVAAGKADAFDVNVWLASKEPDEVWK